MNPIPSKNIMRSGSNAGTEAFAVILLNENMTVEYVNSYFEEIAGIGLEEFKNDDFIKSATESYFKCVDEDNCEFCEAILAESLGLFLKGANYLPAIEWAYDSLMDQSGNKVGILFIGSERKDGNGGVPPTADANNKLFEIPASLPVFAGVFSRDGDLLQVNDFPLQEFKLQKNRCIGKNIKELAWWADTPEVAVKLSEAFLKVEKGGNIKMEIPIQAAKNRKASYFFAINLLAGEEQEESRIAVIGIEYSKLCVERSSTSRLLGTIIESIPNMIFLKGAEDLRFEYFNKAGEELLGIERAELLGRNDYDFFPKEQADFFSAKDRKVLDRFGIMDIPEEPIDTPRGKRYLHTKKLALRDEYGKPQYLMGISEDITERKLTQEKLVFQAKIIDQIHDSVVSTDLHGIVISWNKGAERLHGFSEKEMLGKSILTLVPEGERDEVINNVLQPLLERGEFEVEMNLLHKSGRQFVGHLSFSMLYDNAKNAIGIIGFCLDITERKLLESELESYRDILENQVIERTTALETARDEAERANKAKSQFLSKMSHELRTPLNAILGFAQMLELDSNNFNQIQRENVEEILLAGRHLLNLINDVLDLSKIESGKIELCIETVSLHELMLQCIPLISREAKIHAVSIDDSISEKNYFVKADFFRLKQVLLNLLSNAIKYNIKGGRVYLDTHKNGSGRVRLLIRDTGRGLTDLEIEKLFTPFSRLNGTSNIEGTGIGLVIAKEIVIAMGGYMGVESSVGEGSSFWIELEDAEYKPSENVNEQ